MTLKVGNAKIMKCILDFQKQKEKEKVSPIDRGHTVSLCLSSLFCHNDVPTPGDLDTPEKHFALGKRDSSTRFVRRSDGRMLMFRFFVVYSFCATAPAQMRS